MQRPKRLLFLGDSFTCASGMGGGADARSFPAHLAGMLTKAKLDCAPIEMIAEDGYTSAHLLGAMEVLLPQSSHRATTREKHGVTGKEAPYDLVVLSIGSNDVFDGIDKAVYQKYFSELLTRAVKLAGNNPAKVMVLSIPAYDASPSANHPDSARNGLHHRQSTYPAVQQATLRDANFNTVAGIAAQIDAFNAVAKKEINKKNMESASGKVQFVDLTELTRRGATKRGKTDASLFANDGIHYASSMYQRWAETVFEQAKEILLHGQGEETTRKKQG